MKNLKRGVKIKPVYIGIHYYHYVYGSVCSADMIGTPRIPAPTREALEKADQEMVEKIKENIEADFVEIEAPLIIKEHRDMMKMPSQLGYDADAMLVELMEPYLWKFTPCHGMDCQWLNKLETS